MYGVHQASHSIGKASGHRNDHSPSSSAEIKNAWSYTSTPPYDFEACTGTSLPFMTVNIISRDIKWELLCVLQDITVCAGHYCLCRQLQKSKGKGKDKVVPLLTMQSYSRNGSTAPFVSKDCNAFTFIVKQFKKNSEDGGTIILWIIWNHFFNDTA